MKYQILINIDRSLLANKDVSIPFNGYFVNMELNIIDEEYKEQAQELFNKLDKEELISKLYSVLDNNSLDDRKLSLYKIIDGHPLRFPKSSS